MDARTLHTKCTWCKFTGSNARGQNCKLLERRLRAHQRATSEHERNGNDKQDAGCNR
jgi:hypothetical protein